MSKLTMLRDQILIKKVDAERTSGGLFVPETTDNPMDKAVVVATGTAKFYSFGTVPLDTKVGDIVLVPNGAGFDVQLDGEDYKIVPETSILAIFKEDK